MQPQRISHEPAFNSGATIVGFVKQELARLWGLDVSHCPFRFSGIGDILLLCPALIKRTAPIGFMPAIKSIREAGMATLTISDISERLLQALEARAAEHGHSVEAEALQILELSGLRGEHSKLGSLLAEIGRDATLTDEEFAVFDQLRGKAPSRPDTHEHLVRVRQIRDTLKEKGFNAAGIAAAIKKGRP
jgi:plasmid stability protein